MFVIIWIKTGILLIGKINPDNITDGNKDVIVAIWNATCWEDAMLDTKIPKFEAENKKRSVVKNNNKMLPLIVNPNIIWLTITIDAEIIKPIIEYGIDLPNNNSKDLVGETYICSMVPRSFSLTIEREIDITAVITRIIAISPGIKNSVDFNSGLNQNTGSRSMGV